MIAEIKKQYAEKEYFDSIKIKNTTGSEGSIGKMAFDNYLFNNGFIVKGLRNAYHPDAYFYNEQTKEIILTAYGHQYALFYIINNGRYFHMPSSEEEIEWYKNGKCKIIEQSQNRIVQK